MNTKKGVIEVQFNWIFILIAGVLILLFFGSLVLNLKKQSETTIAVDIITNMQTVMSGAEVSANTVNPIEIPNEEIRISCDSISVGNIREGITKNKIVFSPESIKSSSILTWSLSWNFPYHISNFLYITAPRYKYILIDSEKGKEIYSMLPNGLNKELVDKEDISGLRNTGNKLNFVFFNNPKPDEVVLSDEIGDIRNSDVSAINIDSLNNEIEFYRKSGKRFDSVNKKVPYLGNEMIIGAIFSGDAENYRCNAEKAFYKMSVVKMVYEKRTEKLREIYSGAGCVSYYSTTPFEVQYSIENIQGIKMSAEKLQMSNDYLQSLSCPTIY
jgi:hypothetical protein